MESKTFLVLWGAIFTVAILLGFLLVGSYISTQQFKQFEQNQIKSDENTEKLLNNSKIQYQDAMNTTLNQFYTQNNESKVIHDFVFDNITELKKDLDPITNEIKNATQMRVDQEKHYEQAIIHFNELNVINQTMNKILEILNGTSGTNGTIIPVPIPIDNTTDVKEENETDIGMKDPKGLPLS